MADDDILTPDEFSAYTRMAKFSEAHRLDLVDHDKALRAERDAALARAEELAVLCNESNSTCICGCPPQIHEMVDEGAESCGRDDHECIRTSRSVASLYRAALARAEKAEEALGNHSDLAGIVAVSKSEYARLIASEAEAKRLREALSSLRFDQYGQPSVWPSQEKVQKVFALAAGGEPGGGKCPKCGLYAIEHSVDGACPLKSSDIALAAEGECVACRLGAAHVHVQQVPSRAAGGEEKP